MLEAQRIQLTGSAAEQAQLRAQQEREARIKIIETQLARRMLMGELRKGWNTWQQGWHGTVAASRYPRRGFKPN